MGYDAEPPHKLKKISAARKSPKTSALEFLCEWEGVEIPTMEFSSVIKSKSHQDALKIIDFYENRLRFDN